MPILTCGPTIPNIDGAEIARLAGLGSLQLAAAECAFYLVWDIRQSPEIVIKYMCIYIYMYIHIHMFTCSIDVHVFFVYGMKR